MVVLWCWNVDNSDRIINISMPLNNLLRILYVIHSKIMTVTSICMIISYNKPGHLLKMCDT
jgi:hypothetical protein